MFTHREKGITPKPVSVFHIKLSVQTFFGMGVTIQLFPSDVLFCRTGTWYSNTQYNIFIEYIQCNLILYKLQCRQRAAQTTVKRLYLISSCKRDVVNWLNLVKDLINHHHPKGTVGKDLRLKYLFCFNNLTLLLKATFNSKIHFEWELPWCQFIMWKSHWWWNQITLRFQIQVGGWVLGLRTLLRQVQHWLVL